MRFILEIDVSELTGDPTAEIERILRYWGANLKHYEPKVGNAETINDSAYKPVGSWAYVDPPLPR